MPRPHLDLQILPGRFAVSRLGPTDPIPDWATRGAFTSITRTGDELSVVSPEDLVPAGVRTEPGWRALRVVGTQDFALVGILAALTAPLADSGVSLFAVATFDTDYLLVKSVDLDRALAALREVGHSIHTGTD